jgi:hypothetical protein
MHSGRSTRPDGFELRLLLVIERAVKILQRCANRLDAVEHEVEPLAVAAMRAGGVITSLGWHAAFRDALTLALVS